MAGERDVALRRIGAKRDLAWRSRRLAGTVPTPRMIDALTEYARELEAMAAEMDGGLANADRTGAG